MADKRRRAEAIVAGLEEVFPEAKIALDFADPLQLLVAVILSAQCTDKRVNLVTPALFARYLSAHDYATAEQTELEGFISSCGLFRNKARAIIATAKVLDQQFDGRPPVDRAALKQLPGVGNKTAGVVAMHLSGEPALPVDTHVARLALRLGLTTSRDPDRVERDLQKLLPSDRWARAHHVLIWHGRRDCAAKSPRCTECPIATLCPTGRRAAATAA